MATDEERNNAAREKWLSGNHEPVIDRFASIVSPPPNNPSSISSSATTQSSSSSSNTTDQQRHAGGACNKEENVANEITTKASNGNGSKTSNNISEDEQRAIEARNFWLNNQQPVTDRFASIGTSKH
mmetsp:Transcript_24586/g.36081  ORF Transcript_24586/g.36081 Transcript_24586/m.36081 type:complete len:127 (-) Transcript_24586:157-537(-)|eukprot:CAMPEP_0195527326 /NCGR_PEP_ID=MMETSP0794_2-20130614/28928_1 /TAXON_ID=515487 /ORGANISM="Stephanopyxis turris, Strain CCMP 815" /LENGTH=126 /DNA_ID=CAMNT_0040658215 /DNA_START=71 /DNA_END=451 /DNA_ORIENTATION=-